MKRDLELVRTILLEIEAQPSGPPTFGVSVKGKSDAEVLEHIALLIEAGLVNGQIQEGGSGEPDGCVIFRLTWAGHEFLANARNTTVWKKVTSQITAKVGTVSVEVMKQLLAKAATDLLT
jgi:hypothetical protein